jgi:hypothetical protein
MYSVAANPEPEGRNGTINIYFCGQAKEAVEKSPEGARFNSTGQRPVYGSVKSFKP